MNRVTKCACLVATSLSVAACTAIFGADPVPASRPADTQPASRPAATSPSTIPSKLSLNFKDAPLDSVIDFLTQTMGFAVIKEGPLEGRVTIVSKQPVSIEEALTLVNAALKVNGFTAIREDRLLRIAARDKAKKGNIPVHFGGKPEDVANTDELITQVIPIQNVSATKLRDDLKPLIGTDADLTANEGSNTIIITDASSSIRRIVQIIANLDLHEATTAEIRITQLKNANAAAVVKLIDTFFKNQGGGQMSPEMMMRMQQQGQPMPPPRGGSEKHGNSVIAAADDRTNTLIIMGSTTSLKLIDDILKHLDSNPIPASEMKSYQLKFAQAEATAKLINNLFKPPKSDNNDYPFFYRRFSGGDDEAKKDIKVNAAFDERTNTIIITAPAEALKGVEEMIKTLDASPMASADLKVFQLKYADAFTISKLIEDMFKPKDDSAPRFPYFIFSDGPAPQARGGAKVTVTSDDRTNSLIVSAPTELLKLIEDVVKKLDANPATEDTLFIYHLRNGQSANLEYVLNVLFGNVNNQAQNGQQNGQGQPGGPDQQQQGRSANRINNNNNGNGSGSTDSRSSSASARRNNRLNQAGMPKLSPGMAHAVNELTGKVFVVADQDTNALLVTTATKYEKQVRLIIDDLDRPVPQVLIKVLVAEVTHDNSSDLGVDFSILNTRPSGNGQTAGTNFGAALKGGLVVSVIETNITATLHALAEQNKLDVLSRPYLLASDNQLASILIGQSVPFITDTRITDTGQQINSVQYRDIGLSLNVTPHINPDGVVILDVIPEISQLTSQTVPISSTVNAPVIAKRSAESRIAVKDGQTVVIGGLMEDRKISSISKVPLLGDIPYLGLLFSRTTHTKTKTELLIFLTPHVAQRPEALDPSAEDETNASKLIPKAVAPGVFEDHMNGLKRGQLPQTQPTQPISPVNSIDLSNPPKPRNPDPQKPNPESKP